MSLSSPLPLLRMLALCAPSSCSCWALPRSLPCCEEPKACSCPRPRVDDFHLSLQLRLTSYSFITMVTSLSACIPLLRRNFTLLYRANIFQFLLFSLGFERQTLGGLKQATDYSSECSSWKSDRQMPRSSCTTASCSGGSCEGCRLPVYIHQAKVSSAWALN